LKKNNHLGGNPNQGEKGIARAIRYIYDGMQELKITLSRVENRLAYLERKDIDLDTKIVELSDICTHLISSHKQMLNSLKLAAQSCSEASPSNS